MESIVLVGSRNIRSNLDQQHLKQQPTNGNANTQTKDSEQTQPNPTDETQYYTDEEELAKETEWIIKSKRVTKKRKAEVSSEQSPVNLNMETKTALDKKRYVSSAKPPPINITNIDNYHCIYELINNTTKNFNATILNNGTFKINVENEEEYRKLTKILKKNKIEWYSYENDQLRPIKMMAREIHPSCDPEDILKDLRDKNYLISDVINIIKTQKDVKSNNKTKIPLPLFMLVFQREEDISKIYDIKNILGLKVKI